MLRFVVIAVLLILGASAQTPTPAPSRDSRNVKNYTLPPEKRAKAIEYARARNELYFIGAGYGMLVLAGVLATRLAPRFRDWTERLTRRRVLQAYVFTALLLLTIDMLSLPIGMRYHRLALRYEQSIQGWGSWFWDWTKGELIQFAIAGILVWGLYGIIRRSPRRWWLYGWLAGIPVIILGEFLDPLIIQPLFYRFEPLAATQPALASQIQKVVARGGLEIPPSRMFIMNASEKLTSINAYVAGVGASKRVVVWDNTIRKLSPGQTLFVFGHEMGHYVLGHVWIGILFSCAGLFVGLLIIYFAIHWMLQRWGARWSIRGVDDWASLPALMLVAAVLGFLSDPLVNSLIRIHEHNADIYGLEVIHGIVPNSEQAAAQSFQILGETSLSDPDPSPFIEFWLYSHPTIAERVRFAAEYDPWGKGQAPRYLR
jgi:STE24 endopeptidase